MKKIDIDAQKDLLSNPISTVPICLVLDSSPSMSGVPDYMYRGAEPQLNPRPIEALCKGVKRFIESVEGDSFEGKFLDVCIIAFANEAIEILPFTLIEDADPPIIQWNDELEIMEIIEVTTGNKINLEQGTSIGSAVELALEKLDERKKYLKSAGISYKQPQMLLLTDGRPTDETHIEVSKKVRDMVERRKLTVYAIGVGDDDYIDVLTMFNTPDRPPKKLKGLRFIQMFEFFTETMAEIGSAPPGKEPEYVFNDKDKSTAFLNFVEE